MGRSALLRRRLAVILAAWFDGGDASFDHQQAEAAFNPVTISFTLDGAALATTRTPIKPFHDPQPAFGFERAWYFQGGMIMSPDDLGVGQHELSARFTNSTSGLDETDGITFFIDAARTCACLG
jgi:hypothetical protein